MASDNTRYIRRELEDKLFSWIDAPEIIAIRGPRQAGKTTLLEQLKQRLLEKGIKQQQIHYISFEDNIIRMSFEQAPVEFLKPYLFADGRTYFLLDEVQKVNDAGQKLKLCFDMLNNAKLVVTGSASFDLTTMGASLVGRIIFFDLFPFSFSEFLLAKDEHYKHMHEQAIIGITNPSIIIMPHLQELNALLDEYLTFGGYPRIVTEPDREKKKVLLKSLFTTYVENDVVSLYGIKYRDKVVSLLKVLSAMLVGIVKYETLAGSSGLSYADVRNILPLLEDSFVISLVKPFHKNKMNEIRKNPKAYFVDCGMRNCLIGTFDGIVMDKLFENFIYNELRRKHDMRHWRTQAGTEVDFVIVQDNQDFPMPVEVKTVPKISRSLRSFIEIYNPKTAFIVNRSESAVAEHNGCKIYIVPFVRF